MGLPSRRPDGGHRSSGKMDSSQNRFEVYSTRQGCSRQTGPFTTARQKDAVCPLASAESGNGGEAKTPLTGSIIGLTRLFAKASQLEFGRFQKNKNLFFPLCD